MATPQKDNESKADPVVRSKQDRLEAEQAALSASRVAGARFAGGQWVAEDGTPLTDKEAQQAHRAMDKKAMEARERAMLGRNG